MNQPTASIHENQPVRTYGAALADAKGAVILVHGRGATAESMLPLAEAWEAPNIAFFMPQAAGNTWYPYGFMSPTEQNEPYLSSALAMLDRVVENLLSTGIPLEKIFLGGFSQGACLATEWAARSAGRKLGSIDPQQPRRFAGIAGLSGGLIGPNGTPRDYPGSLTGTPVFLGCSDVDFHIPKERVLETAQVFEQLGAQVTTRLYPGMDHTINEEELEFVRQMILQM